MSEILAPATDPTGWIAAMAGAPLGIAAAHAVERFAALRPAGQAEPTGWPGLAAALAAATVGGLALVAGLTAATGEIGRMLGLSSLAALVVAAVLVMLPTLLGGARGAMTLAGHPRPLRR